MVQRFLRGWRTGRTASLAVGALLVGGLLLTAAPPRGADTPAKDAKAPEKKEEKKDPKAALPPPPWPKPLDLVIVGKDEQHTAQVADTVKFINEKLEETWKAEKVVPSRYADDHEFIRRATLDIIGRIATPEEIEQFLKDPEKKRRSMLIERLLASEERYPKHWANMWSNWLLSRSGAFGRGDYHDEMTLWLEDQFASNAPYDEIVTKLLTAKGKNTDNGAVNFLLAHVGEVVPPDSNRDKEGHFQMVPVTSRITRLFLGTQVQCAQCHDHPFYNNIKQKDFWGVNAFLRQVDRDGTPPDPANGKMMAKPGPLELEDDDNVNPDAKVYYEKRNGVVQMTKADVPAQRRARRTASGCRWARTTSPSRASSAARSWPTTSSTTTCSPRRSSTACGACSWAAASSTRWTTSTTRTSRPTRNCSTSWPSASRTTSTTRRS